MCTDTHKYFLQFILKNSHVPTDTALEFCKKSSEEIKDLNDVKTLVTEINEKISKQELKIVLTTCEVTSAVNFTLLNTANDDICKLQNNYTPIETEYFQQLLKEIITTDDHRIQSIACYNLTDALSGNLRKDNIEILLNKWVEEGYLVEKDSYIYLGPRCIVEFAPYFRQHCKDYYASCHLCSEPVFSGKVCSSCKKVMHSHCIEKWLAKHQKCPNCKKIWSEGSQLMNREVEEQDESTDEDEIVRGPTRRKNPRLS